MHERSRLKLYVAGPLFSTAEQTFNKAVRDVLEQAFDVYLPQEDGMLLADLVSEGVSPDYASKMIFDEDVRALTSSNVVLVILDGRTIDEGAAFELGLAYALNKKCVGLQTDVRRLLPWGNNPMISNALEATFSSVAELERWVSSQKPVQVG